jgi:hypothetical protein
MKTLLIAALCLLCARSVVAECVELNSSNFAVGLTPLPSARNVQITVNLDGEPLPNANLIVSTVEGLSFLSVSADAHGVAQLRDLKPGRYVIGANANEAGARILLEVPAKAQKSASLFSLNLVNTFALPYFGGGVSLSKVAEAPANEHFREFTGAVLGADGGGIAGAEIEIYPSDTWDRASLVHSIADHDGHFSVKLPDGIYRAVIHREGFKPYPVVFRILQDGEARNLSVFLQVRSC